MDENDYSKRRFLDLLYDPDSKLLPCKNSKGMYELTEEDVAIIKDSLERAIYEAYYYSELLNKYDYVDPITGKPMDPSNVIKDKYPAEMALLRSSYKVMKEKNLELLSFINIFLDLQFKGRMIVLPWERPDLEDITPDQYKEVEINYKSNEPLYAGIRKKQTDEEPDWKKWRDFRENCKRFGIYLSDKNIGDMVSQGQYSVEKKMKKAKEKTLPP
jgi:hypothetical protein